MPIARAPMIAHHSYFRVASLLLTAACSGDRNPISPSADGTPRWDASPLKTDSLTYHLRRSEGGYITYVTATYRNSGASPVHYARCNSASTGPMFGLRRTGTDSTRTFFTDWGWACVGGVPTGTIAPGDSVVLRVRVGSIDQPRMTPPLQPEHLVGDLRIELVLCARPSADSDYCAPSPQSQRSSNAFNVRY